MDDDRVPVREGIEPPAGKASKKKTKKMPDGVTRRSITEMHPRRHQGIVPLSLWQANQQERKNCGNTPRPAGKPLREYLLSGVGYCWEYHTRDGRQAVLHGLMTNGYQYYRCSTMQGEYTIRSKHNPKVVSAVLNSLRMDASEQKARLDLVSRHRSLLRQMGVEEQVNQIVEQLIIPKE